MLRKIILLAAILPYMKCGKILACVPTPSHSHQVAFYDLWRDLSLRGHQVTLMTANPLNDPKLVNLTEVDLGEAYSYIKDVSNFFENEQSPWNCPNALNMLLGTVTIYTLKHPRVQELLRGRDKFDVIFVEHLYPELLVLGRIYKCPTILVSSTDVDQVFYQAMGDPTHPVSHPHYYWPYHVSPSFSERLWSTLYYCYIWYFYKFHNAPLYQENVRKYLNISINLEDLVNDIDLLFVNSHPVIHGARAAGPGTIFYNYNRGPSKVQPIEKSVKEFMDNAKNGFIYFSLGSNVKSNELNRDLFETIKETLRELPYKVLYKYDGEVMPGQPDNVKIIKWAPQSQILNHPNIILFVNQGGRQSTEEAVYAAVPMVIIPFFYDQDHDAYVMKARGVAEVVHRRPLRKDELGKAMREVISNPRYKKASVQLRKLALDVPINGLEKAIWWTEHVIRNKGAKHLRNPVADLPLYQFLLLDVIGFLVLIFVTVSALVYALMMKLIPKLRDQLRKDEKLD